jgi:hypothetical protein
VIGKLRTQRDDQQWMLDLALNMRGRILYVRENGDGPWSDCDWTPPVRRGQAYF